MVFTLSDDCDQEQEVLFDSAIPQQDSTIQKEILRRNARLLRRSFREQFLEIVCLLVESDDSTNRGNSWARTDSAEQDSENFFQRMTVREARLSQISLLVLDSLDTTGDVEGEEEPGSPIFHDAIMFSSQVQLNDLCRSRRGGLRQNEATERNLEAEANSSSFELESGTRKRGNNVF